MEGLSVPEDRDVVFAPQIVVILTNRCSAVLSEANEQHALELVRYCARQMLKDEGTFGPHEFLRVAKRLDLDALSLTHEQEIRFRDAWERAVTLVELMDQVGLEVPREAAAEAIGASAVEDVGPSREVLRVFGGSLESRVEKALEGERVRYRRVNSPANQVTFHLLLDSELDVVTHVILKNGRVTLFSSFKGLSDRMAARPATDSIRGDCQVLAVSMSGRLRLISAQVANGQAYASAEVATDSTLDSRFGDALLLFRSECLRFGLALSLLEGGQEIGDAVDFAMRMGM